MAIEHNLYVIKTADYIIDLGPEGGDAGGEVVALGTPEEVARVASSYTGQYLKTVLQSNKPASSGVGLGLAALAAKAKPGRT